mmetsp:Transcript_124672/g.233120  ORF Transcript_124672/g.233120 Transcript_124672/m.233120 type:complete len:1137 (-) Transcript_124672:25-3435(-)
MGTLQACTVPNTSADHSGEIREMACAESPKMLGTFAKVFSFEYEAVPVVLYRCTSTGLRVALARVQSPTVHGYFAVQTEAFDDYGCPHTLEHLIFMGSDKYPYKGVLDVLANRCFAQGTNAWTDTDHTCYTVDTAGSEGFLKILPVFLDHVLFPTLKDTAFVTEVHHINGEGANAGVVYCEMQARENEAGDMVDRAVKLAAYPGRCSYKSETGGRLKELRELNNETIRNYHKDYYRPENLCVIVTGQVDESALCEAMAPVVESIKKSEKIKALPEFERPFSSPVPKPEKAKTERIEFPAEDEKTGAVCEFAWHGPTWTDFETIVGLQVLMTYLTQDAIAPLRKAFVETAPALCASVSHCMVEQTVYLMSFMFKSVDVEQLTKRDIDAEVTAVLQATAAESGIDLARIHSLMGQKRRKHFSSVESSPHDLYSGEILGAFLYAPGFAPSSMTGRADCSAELQARFNLPACLDELQKWPAARWADLCNTWFLGPASSPRVSVYGMPSKACGERIQSEDASRIAAQKESLGDDGCKKCAEGLAAAETENDVDTPEEVVQEYQLPDAAQIKLINVSTVTAHGGAMKPGLGPETEQMQSLLEKSASCGSTPAPAFQFDHAAGAQFASCCVLLPTEGLTPQQLALMPLWCSVAFELPLVASDAGPAMSYDAVVQALTDATVSYSLSRHSNMLQMSIKVERARYPEAAFWIGRVLSDADFDVERLRVAAKKILNTVPDTKRNSRALMRMALSAMAYSDSSPEGACNIFRLENTLTKLVEAEGAMEQASKDLAEIRAAVLAAPHRIFVRVGADLGALGGSDAYGPWRRKPFLSEAAPESVGSFPLPALARELHAEDALQPEPGQTGGCLISSSAEESNYWIVQSKSFTDNRSPELAPLLVAIEYCTALEGPFWRKLRGRGLTYSYGLSHSCETGFIRFNLTKATDPLAAYAAAGEIVMKLCSAPSDKEDAPGDKEDKPEAEEVKEDEEDEDGEDEDGLDPSALEAAQSGVLFSLIEEVDTIPSAMGEAFDNTLSRVPLDQLQWLLKEVQAVTLETAQAALRKHVLPLFTGLNGRTVSLVCPAQKRKQVEEGLQALKPPFQVMHMEVDAFVKAVAPDNGFASLRAQACENAGIRPSKRPRLTPDEA